MAKTKNEAAANALLAYYNHGMATRLVRWVMKTATPEAQKLVAEAVLLSVGRMVENGDATVVDKIRWKAERLVDEYVAAPAFTARVQAFLTANHDKWMQQIVAEQMRARATREISEALRTRPFTTVGASLQTEYRVLLEEELRKAIPAKAAEIASNTKPRMPEGAP